MKRSVKLALVGLGLVLLLVICSVTAPRFKSASKMQTMVTESVAKDVYRGRMENKAALGGRAAAPQAPAVMAEQMASDGAPMEAGAASDVASIESAPAAKRKAEASSGSTDKAPKPDRMVQYDASAKLSVDSPEETYRRVGQMATENGGFIQRLDRSGITIRVPVATIRTVFKSILGLGIVLEKWMRADDITDAFFDTELRVQVNKALMAKLRQYLIETKDNKVRLSLLREIEQLSEEIIRLESQMRSMQHLAAFSSITVQALPRKEMELKSLPEDVAAFRWIVALNPMNPVLPLFRLDSDEVPEGFVITESGFTAETAEGDLYRLSTVQNNPEGNLEFWRLALRHRLGQRFNIEGEEKAGAFVDLSLRMPSGDPVRYHVMIAMWKEVVRVVEVTYLSPEQETKYHSGVRKLLSQLK